MTPRLTTADPFDPERLRLTSTNGTATADRKPKRPPRHQPGEWFLKGPVPWAWLDVAGRLRGRALHVGLCLWREAGRRNCRTVRLCLATIGLGLTRSAARRGLSALESARLVRVERMPGRCLTVELLEAPITA
jgi:hypothetical protein